MNQNLPKVYDPHEGPERDNPNYPGMPIVAVALVALITLIGIIGFVVESGILDR